MNRKPENRIFVGALFVVAGVTAYVLLPGLIWWGAVAYGIYDIVSGTFIISRRKQIARLVESGASHWTCKSCGQANPMEDGFVCSRCKVPFTHIQMS